MPSRRDQLFSQQYLLQRVISAFVYRDSEAARTPFPRAFAMLMTGAMVAVLLLAGVGIYGVISPGNKKSWRSEDVLIVEKETGARFVYFDGKLHPVLNYTSARLILKKPNPSVVTVSRASLLGAERGAPLGISGAPDSAPAESQLRTGSWTLCSRPVTTASGGSATSGVLYIAQVPPAGRALGDDALLVRYPDKTLFLVWHGYRFRIDQPQLVLTALALADSQVAPVAAAFVDGIPQGPDIGPIAISGRGEPAELSGARVGQVVVAKSQSGVSQFFAVLGDGITEISELQADLLLNDPRTAVAYPGSNVEPLVRSDLGAARRSTTGLDGAVSPDTRPTSRPHVIDDAGESALCAVHGQIDQPVQLTVGADLPAQGTGVVAAKNGKTAGPDEVVVPSGSGVLAEAVAGADAPAGTLTLITDQGIRYSLASRDIADYLGYGSGKVVRMPVSLVAMLRQGPALNAQAARTPVGSS